jgi:predicted amidohydrolase YtcJ
MLWHGGRIRTGRAGEVASWMLVDGGTVVATGTGPHPEAERRYDLDGTVVVPAFCDAHVHLPATGLYLAGMSFRGERSSARIAAAFAERARAGEAILFGGDFEDPLDAPLNRDLLDAVVGDRPALLARADMHSCIVSSGVLDGLDLEGLDGVDRDGSGRPTGYLREHAAAQAWRWFDSNLPPDQLRAAIARAAEHACSRGVGSVHEMHVVEWRGWESLEITRAVADTVPLDVVFYVATTDVERVDRLGLGRVGGDLFLDGSLGSHTAWMSDPYDPPPPLGSPPAGIAYRTDEELVDFFGQAQARGLQAAVHAIGDAAIEQGLRAWETVARATGAQGVRALGHRIEHFECASDTQLQRAAKLGLRASVQPAFDRLWGGPGGMYARRLGVERAAPMNRFASMLERGIVVGAGSDSTVTPLDPFLQMAALREHHVAGQRIDAQTALEVHTRGAHALAGRDASKGTLTPGMDADFTVLDRDPVTVEVEELLQTEVLETWIEGRRAWPGTNGA